jgi:transposase
MTAWRRAVELALESEDVARLTSIARSRTEPASRVERARMLLAYRENPSFFAVGRAFGVHHQTVQRCMERALAYGPMAALDDRPRPGREPTITAEAKAWLVSLACRKAKDLDYPHGLWTTRLLARHAREHGPAEGHPCLGQLVQGTVCKILDEQEVKPHKVRYYLERRDPKFAEKMAEVLCVYRTVKLLKETAAASKQKPSEAVAIIYDEKPGIQAIATTSPDLSPEPGKHATIARDHEYKRHGTVSLLAGIDLLTGKVHALVKDRHRSREFIEFLKLLDIAYPAHTAIYPRQSFRAYLQGDKGVACRSTCRPLRVHLHAQARLLAQSRRRLLLETRSLRPASHPRRIQTGTQGPHHGRDGRIQPASGRTHLVL